MAKKKKIPRGHLIGADEVCSVCGKKILVVDKGRWVYKNYKGQYQCSWTCYLVERGKKKYEGQKG